MRRCARPAPSPTAGADFAEVLVISDRITAGDYDSWHDAYLAAADRIAAEADDTLAAGHRISARDGLLRAHSYYRSADFFLHGNPDDPRHYHAFNRSVECFQAARLFTTPIQPVAILCRFDWLEETFSRVGTFT